MVMKKMTAYRKRSYRRYYRRYRSVSNQYFPCRVEGVYTIAFPTESGSPLFYDTAGNVSYVVEWKYAPVLDRFPKFKWELASFIGINSVILGGLIALLIVLL